MEKIKDNLQDLGNLGIVHYSIQLDVKKDADGNFIYKKNFPDRFEKIPTGIPKYKNVTLVTKRLRDKNSCIIPMGESYNLIGIDIDNKDDTLEKYNDLCAKNNFDRITFTMKTMHDGYHEYYNLTTEQKLLLKNFASLDGKLFGLNIDVKYNNQILFGPSSIQADKEYTYEILYNIQPVILPDFLFKELLKHITYKKKDHVLPKVKKLSITPDTTEEYVDDTRDFRLKLYLDCLLISRFENYDDWLKIGFIIFNEKGNYLLWDKYSKNSSNYDNTCEEKWKTFTNDNVKKANIKTLIEMSKDDNYELYRLALLKDKVGIIDEIISDGIGDLTGAQLFYCLNQNTYIYDVDNNDWYKFNEYGIYIPDKNNILLKSQINETLLRSIEIEFITKSRNSKNEEARKLLMLKYAQVRKSLSCNFKKEGMIKELALLYKKINISTKLNNANNYVFAFSNGVYDLKTMKFRNGYPEELITCTCGYSYQKPSKGDVIELTKILQTIMPDHEELNYLLKSISLGLSGVNILEEFYIWIGRGANGKGLLGTLIEKTLGDYYDCLDIEYLCKSNQKRNPNSTDSIMSRKKNSRMIITTEPEGDTHLKCGKLKELTGGDTIQVRELFGKAFNFKPKFKLIIQTNCEPVVDGSDAAVIRRLRLIKFPMQFVDNPKLSNEGKIDRTLKNKMEELRYKLAFFQILLDYYNDFASNDNNKLTMPKRIQKDTTKFIYANDPVKQFIMDELEITNDKNDSLLSSILYKNFIDYNEDKNNGITQAKFKNIMLSNGINFKRTNKGSVFLNVKNKSKILNEETNEYLFIDEEPVNSKGSVKNILDY